MTDWSTMHRYETSRESVAFKLMLEIAKADKKLFSSHPRLRATAPDRQWILDTYSECLERAWATHHQSNRSRIHCHPQQTATA